MIEKYREYVGLDFDQLHRAFETVSLSCDEDRDDRLAFIYCEMAVRFAMWKYQ